MYSGCKTLARSAAVRVGDGRDDALAVDGIRGENVCPNIRV